LFCPEYGLGYGKAMPKPGKEYQSYQMSFEFLKIGGSNVVVAGAVSESWSSSGEVGV
jgi:hypothetical protein